MPNNRTGPNYLDEQLQGGMSGKKRGEKFDWKEFLLKDTKFDKKKKKKKQRLTRKIVLGPHELLLSY